MDYFLVVVSNLFLVESLSWSENLEWRFSLASMKFPWSWDWISSLCGIKGSLFRGDGSFAINFFLILEVMLKLPSSSLDEMEVARNGPSLLFHFPH